MAARPAVPGSRGRNRRCRAADSTRSGDDCFSEGAQSPPPRLAERYDTPGLLADVRAWVAEPVRVETGWRTFFAPTTLDEALSFKRKFTPCTIVQGATDVGVWINKRAYSAATMMSLAKLRELNDLREEDVAPPPSAARDAKNAAEGADRKRSGQRANHQRCTTPKAVDAGVIASLLDCVLQDV